MPYSFDQIFAADPSTPGKVASNGVVTIFTPGDTTQAPLAITTVDGLALANPIQVNDAGYGPAFMHATLDRVAWAGGGFEGFLTSYDGMKEEAVAARVSAQESASLAAEAVANTSAPTQTAIAAALTAEGPARDTVAAVVAAGTAGLAMAPHNGGRAVGRGEINYNQFSRAYQKKVLLDLNFKNPDWTAITNRWGSVYPQAFCVDEVSRHLFISSPSSTFNVVSVYNWDTGAYLRSFAMETTGTVSEGAIIQRKGDKRFLYLRLQAGALSEIDITTLPAAMSVVSPARTIPLNIGGNFTYRNGTWTLNDNTPPIGGWRSRANYKRMDDTFKYQRNFMFPDEAAGYPQESTLADVTPKMQGLCEGDGFFAVSQGACQVYSAPASPYAYHGIKIVSGHGDVTVDSMFAPHPAMDILRARGYSVTRLESEGVQIVDGRLVTFNITDVGTSGGLMFVEEFSNEPDAIDFSPAAITWTVPAANALQSGNFPLSHDGKLRNLSTGAVLGTLPEICEYMRDTGMSTFSFYSSSVTVVDVKGDNLPTYNYITIHNADNSQFRVEMLGASDANGGYLQVYKNRNTGEWVQGNITLPFRADMTPGVDVGASIGTAARRVKQVVTRDGVVLSSPNGTAYRISVSDAGALSAVKV